MLTVPGFKASQAILLPEHLLQYLPGQITLMAPHTPSVPIQVPPQQAIAELITGLPVANHITQLRTAALCHVLKQS